MSGRHQKHPLRELDARTLDACALHLHAACADPCERYDRQERAKRPELAGASVAYLRVSENNLASRVGVVQWVVGAYVRLHFLADSRVDSHGTRLKAAEVAHHC